MTPGFPILALALAASLARVDLHQRIEACSYILDDNARLVCFDQITKDLVPTPRGSAPAAAATPQPLATSRMQAISSQCEGITKRGTRCSRKAKAGSAYCWQHQ